MQTYRETLPLVTSPPPGDRAGGHVGYRQFDAAVSVWVDAGLSTDIAAAIADTEVRLLDLTGAHLAAATSDEIWLDLDAAGFGWLIDPTPYDDSEFQGGESPAAERMDLLTVLAHQIGHRLGGAHAEHLTGGLMDPLLGVGERRLPTAADVNALLSDDDPIPDVLDELLSDVLDEVDS